MANGKWQIGNRFQRGFTVIELLLSMSIFALLIGIVTLNLNTAQHKATISSTLETLISDISQQQINAMVGETEGRAQADTYGINFASTKYILFHGTYNANDSTNFSITLPTVQTITSTFPSSQLIFSQGSGEVQGFNAAQNTITVKDTMSGEQKIITINKYGAITSVN